MKCCQKDTSNVERTKKINIEMSPQWLLEEYLIKLNSSRNWKALDAY